MLKSIIVATDLSSRSEPAVRRAVGLSKAFKAKLCVLHVVEDDLLGGRMYAEINRIEDDLSEQVSGFGWPEDCEVAVAAGHASHLIGEEAQDRRADLIVMGVHRRQMLRDVFMGTTIERVTRTAGRPVLMANTDGRTPWRKIFIATDLSQASAQAARTAQALGLLDGAEVTFIHGFPPIAHHMMTHAGIPADRVQEEAERQFQSARSALDRFIAGLNLQGLTYDARIIEGVGADAIAGFVEQAKPDLLVIGTRGLSGVKRLFLGSVAQDLMGKLAVDVLAVPPQV